MSNYETVKDTVGIVDYIGRFVDLKEESGKFVGLCPFHEDGDPSFTVYPDTGKFHCYGCEAHGDVTDFTSLYFKLPSIEALKKVASDNGIQLANSEYVPVPSVDQLKRDATEYMHQTLLKNEDAMKYLLDRGITRADAMEWKIGLSNGHVYDHFKEVYQSNGIPDFDLLIASGIANKAKEKVYNYIRNGILTFPVRVGAKISHWILREVGGKSNCYQIQVKKRGEGLFFNQKAMDEKKFWLVEGPCDVISMTKAGFNTAGTNGPPNKDQLAYLRGLCQFSDEFPDDLGESKEIRILFDRDKNNSGQRRAVSLAHNLAEFHTIHVYQLPMKKDPDKFIREGGNVLELESRKVSHTKSMLHEKGGVYFFEDDKGREVISNFIIKPLHEIVDDDGLKKYQVIFECDGITDGPYWIDSGNWRSETNFREWLGACGGHYHFTGGMKALLEMKRYWFENYKPRPIIVTDRLGRCKDGLWLFDDAAMHHGEMKYADKNGVIWVDDYGVDGIRTTEFGRPNQLTIPRDFYSPEQAIERFHYFYYNDDMLWSALGYATASAFFPEVSGWSGCFPVAFCYGPKGTGKTRYARNMASFCGAGNIQTPAGLSTGKGLHRTITRHHSFPIPFNEFKGKSKEAIVVAFYDLDPYVIGKATGDVQTTKFDINTSCILTSTKPPERDDLISRLLTIDFHGFKRNDARKSEFISYHHEAVKMGANFGILHALVQVEGGAKRVLDVIQRTQSFFSKHISEIDGRQLLNFSIMYGSFLAAYEMLNLKGCFKKLQIQTPSAKALLDSYERVSKTTTRLMEEQTEMRVFLELMEGMYIKGNLHGVCALESDPRGDYLIFHLTSVFPEVLKEDARMGANKLQGITKGWVSKNLKKDLDVRGEVLSIAGITRRHHKLYLDEVESKYNVQLENLTQWGDNSEKQSTDKEGIEEGEV